MKNENQLVERKQDHIDLAFQSRIDADALDRRFSYEPVLTGHPPNDEYPTTFLGKKLRLPLWVSSMTGGTKKGRLINENLARACADFGMGMGLGSCRPILRDPTHFNDFNVRSIIGRGLPLYGNLGIAQIQELISRDEVHLAEKLVDSLQLDGLIVHINPLQEALQPEGDQVNTAPLETLESFLNCVDFPVIAKEVGQGMGPKSLKALFQLPLAAISFGASGGTNFALLELLRSNPEIRHAMNPLVHVGHSASEMVDFTNKLIGELGDKMKCREVIVSGGIADFLDGYYLINRVKLNSVYGQASLFLQHALDDYEELEKYVANQARGLALAKAYLTPKDNE
ncbi:MAG: isopentenyl-diphosphate delta-isomerase [Saprospiraceae bacterium]|nr:isopentenyl-diphosphate delta-isomerase [Saprospiraceae bacterium]